MIIREKNDVANAEITKTLQWFSKKCEQICEELREKGLGKGLDGNRDDFVEAHKELARRMEAIGKKYNLPRVQKNRPNDSSG